MENATAWSMDLLMIVYMFANESFNNYDSIEYKGIIIVN